MVLPGHLVVVILFSLCATSPDKRFTAPREAEPALAKAEVALVKAEACPRSLLLPATRREAEAALAEAGAALAEAGAAFARAAAHVPRGVMLLPTTMGEELRKGGGRVQPAAADTAI